MFHARITATCLALLISTGVPALAKGQVASHVHMLRGQYGVFSWGLDDLARQLKRDGHVARVRNHDQWRRMAADIVALRQKGGPAAPLVLIGHSLGGNGVTAAARQLADAGIGVDLLVVLDAPQPQPLPRSVTRALNYFIADEGWGRPLVAEPGFRGRIDNADLSSDRSDLQDGATQHTTITRNPAIQREILDAIRAGLSRLQRPKP